MTEKLLLTRQEVEEACGLTTSTLYRLMRNHDFPPPIKIASQGRRWIPAEIREWIAAQERSNGDGIDRPAIGRARKAAEAAKATESAA